MKTAEDYLIRKPHNCDENPMPKWGIGPDGRHVLIDDDAEYISAFTEWQKEACDHQKIGIIKWVNGGGATCYNWFCAFCGSKLSANIPHQIAKGQEKNAHLDAMASRSLDYSTKRLEVLREIKDATAKKLQVARRAEYADYRESPQWKALTDRVIRRAKGVCEGCLTEPAILAHHKTYDHLGEEFAFELLALCSECHDRFHED